MSPPEVGAEVMFHGRRWVVTGRRETNEDEWFACHEVRLDYDEGVVGHVTLWVDQCAVRKAPQIGEGR